MRADHSARIFIVEDEALIAMELEDRLLHLGYDICGSSARGESALQQIPKLRPELVLMDVQLAGALDGIETIRQLREISDLPVVLLTAYSDDELIDRANEVGVSSYLVKPIQERELHATIQTALSRVVLERDLRKATARSENEQRFSQSTLDALESRVAVLDESGNILTVNRAWRNVEQKCGGNRHVPEVGSNYLGACAEGGHNGGRGAQLVADAMSTVIRGDAEGNPFEFRCNCREDPTWLRCSVTRFPSEGPLRIVVVFDDVSSIYEARERTATEERVLQSITGSDAIGVLRTNREGRLIYLNDYGCELLGMTQDIALKKGLLRLLHPEDSERILCGWESACREGQPYQAEGRILQPGGDVIWITGQVEVIRNAQDECVGHMGTLTDITERKRGELAMEIISTELIRLNGAQFFETSLLRLCELLGSEIALLPRLGKVEGTELRCIAMVVDSKVISNPTCPAPSSPCHSVFDGQSVLIRKGAQTAHPNNELLIQAKAEFYCHEPVIASDGSVIGSLAVISRKEIRDSRGVSGVVRLFAGAIASTLEREQAEQQYADLFEFAPSGFVMTDSRGVITHINREAENMFKWSRAEVIGEKIELLVPEASKIDHIRMRQMFTDLPAEQQLSLDRPRQLGVRKDGTEFPVEIGLAPIGSSQFPQVIAAVRDVTMKQALEQKVGETQKMEAVGELAGGIAHDFNNLLTAINGLSHLLNRRIDPTSREGAMVKEIARAGARAAALTRQLLTFSRRQVDHPRSICVNDVVTGAETMIRYLVGEPVTLCLELEDDLSSISADPSQVEQVVVNLSVNARDAMLTGGELKIRSSSVRLDQAQVDELPGLEKGGYVVLEVSDTGTGIEPELLQHIFEPFFTTKGRANGTGLGLAVVYGIVKQGQGAIAIDSELGKGTTFRIYFPSIDDAPELAHVPVEEGVLRAGKQCTVLLVEDEPTVQVLAQTVLEEAGYFVYLATSGEQALDIIAESADSIDVLLTDIVLPGISGQEVASAFKGTDSDVNVLFMSGYSAQQFDANTLVDGSSFLQKPFQPPELIAAIEAVVSTC